MDYPPGYRLQNCSAFTAEGATPRKAIKKVLKAAKKSGLDGGGTGLISVTYFSPGSYVAVYFMEDA
jgi:hypothetical protein